MSTCDLSDSVDFVLGFRQIVSSISRSVFVKRRFSKYQFDLIARMSYTGYDWKPSIPSPSPIPRSSPHSAHMLSGRPVPNFLCPSIIPSTEH